MLSCQHQSAARTFGHCCYGDTPGTDDITAVTSSLHVCHVVTSLCVRRLRLLQDQVVLAVRQQYVAIGDQVVALGDGDEVAVVPPLSGG